jgi:hypothetical protein
MGLFLKRNLRALVIKIPFSIYFQEKLSMALATHTEISNHIDQLKPLKSQVFYGRTEQKLINRSPKLIGDSNSRYQKSWKPGSTLIKVFSRYSRTGDLMTSATLFLTPTLFQEEITTIVCIATSKPTR